MLQGSLKFNRKNILTRVAIVFVVTFVFLTYFWFLAGSALVHAQAAVPGDTTGLAPIERSIALSGTDIRVIVARIIRAVLGLLGVIAIAIVSYAGYMWMTAGGNEEQIGKAKTILRNWVIGLALILSAFSITQFVLNNLLRATGAVDDATRRILDLRPPLYTGALGSIIRDHYPERNARNVARNTKIMITFTEPMKADTLIIDNNGANGTPNGIIGDCITRHPEGSPVQVTCDKINSANVLIRKTADANGPYVTTAEATMTSDKKTFVFKPIEPLGSSVEPTFYTVYFGGDIRRETGDRAFSGVINFYEWSFEIGTTLDLSPPNVTRFSPVSSNLLAKNTLAQISFNEAMDPTFIAGGSATLPFVRVVEAPLVSNKAATSTAVFDFTRQVAGKFEVSNGYKTITFIPNTQCGENACGDPMFCFPGRKSLTFLFYTGLLRNPGSPESIPLTGVSDASGNALDGRGRNADEQTIADGIGRADGPPTGSSRLADSTPDYKTVDFGADNFYWIFGTKDEMDVTPPKTMRFEPDVLGENVDPNVSSTVFFSEEMSYASLLDNASITADFADDALWGYFSRLCEAKTTTGICEDSNSATSTATKLRLLSAEPMGQENGIAAAVLFATHVLSRAQDLSQNCFYPSAAEFPLGVDGAKPMCGDPQDAAGRIGSARPSCCNNSPTAANNCGL